MVSGSRKRTKNGKKLAIGPMVIVVICIFQLVVVWHWFQKALPYQDTSHPLIEMSAYDIRGRRPRNARQDEEQQQQQQQVIAPLAGAPKTNTSESSVILQRPEEEKPKDISNEIMHVQDQQQGIPPLAQHDNVITHQSLPHDNTTIKLWHQSSSLPKWIQDYFDWAVEQQQNLTPDNWKSQRYVVMQCLQSDAHCGGTSDRLKPIPLVILIAMRSKRILYIKWTRPCAIEEFLLPPSLGYNWTIPEWLVPLLMDHPDVRSRPRMNNQNFIDDANRTDLIVLRARLQTFDGGSIYFNEEFNNTGVSYESIYHDLFRILFEPSPPVQAIIDAELKSVGLTPGNYATAHYRAFYGKRMPDNDKIRSTAINAVECASILRPGGPIYFASDSKFAISSIQSYAQQYNRPVVIIENDEPLHLDKANSTLAKDYYSVFVDLFLLGMGKCASVGMGGFGRYGLLLSYNASCWNRHSYNKQRMDCQWKDADNGTSAVAAVV